ncbi:Fic family protein [Pseudoduganella sp. OTU4001]|uniref:Fic family protein n=1 Tax=Pseudoduganella sp. OTU4001 TaxID=3043854 RepID=UPI00313E8D69
MERGLIGHYEGSAAAGEACRALVPAPLPPTPELTIGADLQVRLGDAWLALGRLDSLAVMLPNASMLLYSFVRKEAVMSSQIEGTQSSLADLLLYEAAGAPGVPLEDVREVSCHVDALMHGMQRLQDGFPICTRLMNEMHSKLMAHGRGPQKAPGELRRIQNWIGGSSPNRAVFVPAPPQHIADCMSDLEKYMNDVPVRHAALIKAALAHVQFETIHPYLDGNGRLGRLLIPLLLVSEGVLRHPMLYLSLYFREHRGNYYTALQNVRLTGNWEEWLRFFATAIVHTAEQAMETASALLALAEVDRQRLEQLGRLAPFALQVHRSLSERPVSTIAAICQAASQSPHTVAKVLSAMQSLGMVREVTGMKRNRIYEYTACLAILNRDIQP